MKITIFPDTSGDVVVGLKPHDDGHVTLDAVEKTGASIPFGELLSFSDGGGHIDVATPLMATNLGFPTVEVRPANNQLAIQQT